MSLNWLRWKRPSVTPTTQREKRIYIGAPECFRLEMALQLLNEAFDEPVSYVVGSCLKHADYHDVDVRMIMSNEKFAALFPMARFKWQHDPLWIILSVSISMWLKEMTGLPIDFQFQPQMRFRKDKPVYPLGLRRKTTASTQKKPEISNPQGKK